MSDLTNRAAYLKGLADGMKLDKESNEGKLLNEIIALLGDITEEMEMIDDEQGFIADKLDDIDESIDILCEEVFEDELYEYDEDDFDEEDEFAIKCEKCGKDILVL
jgi:NifB/MoaA-like Fe-S oxidoreductase